MFLPCFRLLFRRGSEDARTWNHMASVRPAVRLHQVCRLHLQGELTNANTRQNYLMLVININSERRCPSQGSTGEVHCEKVTCPPLTCSRPIRRNPSDCCKECPAEDTPPLEDDEMMQADGTRHCKFGKNYYQNSEHWHPSVPLVGEMKCITCWCDVSSALFLK